MKFNHIPIDVVDIHQINTPNGRVYEIEPGVLYPSITNLLGVKEKPWLNDWKLMLGNKKADKETKRCAERGTAVHLIAEYFLQNDPNYLDGHTQKTLNFSIS